ncbi:MAG: histidine kinase [Candidatus Parabeggiatoa sp. nov. 1]|nr:MAG: histidine kinase [Gammaproteobacteria bacterium]
MINEPSAIQFGSGTRFPFFRSMRGKLILQFLAVSLIPLAIVGGVAITQLHATKAAANEVSDNYFPGIIHLKNAEIALLHIIEAQKNHIIAQDDVTMKRLETEIQHQRANLVKALAGFERTLYESTETEAFEIGRAVLNDFLQTNNQVILLSQTNDDEKAQSLSIGTANNRLENALGLMDNMRKSKVFGFKKAKSATAQAARTGITLTLIASLVFTVIVVMVAFLVANSIAKPVLIVTEAARKLTAGNVKSTDIGPPIEVYKFITRRDEIGEIGRAFDALTRYFQEVIADIVQVSQGLAASNLSVTPQCEYRGDFAQIKQAQEMALFNQQQMIEDIIHVFQGLAEGNLHVAPQTKYQGDFAQIKNALQTVLSDLREVCEDIVQISQEIENGNLYIMPQAEYRGDFIQIRNSLEMTAANLAEVMAKNADQDWLKTGKTQLNEQIRGEKNIVTLAKNIISFLTTYLNAQVGLFYRLKEPNHAEQGASLQMIASYAYTASENTPTEFLVGEGLVGQAALDKKAIYRTHRADECTYIIQSGLTKAAPRYVIIIPFLYENAVKGVIEIGFANALTDIQREFIERVMQDIGIVVNTAESRAKMQELLEQSQLQAEELQAQSEELQAQQEELQQTNKALQAQREELQYKQEALQHQNEELQTQSEELQTQQEELKQANEALEERTQDLVQQKHDVQQKNVALEKNQADMKKAQVALETKAHELELANQYKSEFLANMSHELRTPLNSLLILAQLLANNKLGNLTDEQVEYAQTIQSAGSDLLTLINDILDLSKVEAGKMEAQIEELVLSDLAEALEQKFRLMASEKGLVFQMTLADDLPPFLHTDGQLLKQIINNLLSNAFKFTSQGEIKLDMRPSSSQATLKQSGVGKDFLEPAQTIAFSVMDTGIGIPKDKQKLIFEAFQQVDGSTSRHYGGTGLGLSISRQLARLLGGELKLETEAGKGSTFTLYLPEKRHLGTPVLTSSEVQEALSVSVLSQTEKTLTDVPTTLATPAEVTAPINDDRATLKPEDKSILIIEDDSKFAKILMALAREKHFKCLTAADGNTGLQLAEEYQPNAIILDVGLPQLDGWQVMELLKDNPDTRHIPVHFISGADQSMEATKMGAIGYLQKPVSIEQVGETFNSIEQFITNTVKNILVVVDNEIHQQQIQDIVGSEDVQSTLAVTIAEALQHLKIAVFNCIILDMDIEQRSGSQLLEQMQQIEGFCQIPIIVYAERYLTPSEEALLLRCTDQLPIKAVNSLERLLDETTLFLHQIEANLPKDKRNILRMVHDKEAILAKKKVLIVDDDARNVFALATVLEEKNMEVFAGDNGYEALQLLEEHPDIAVVLMDIMMPEMDGYEATKKIREQLCFQKLPIIALTAKAMKGDKAKCIKAGANDYLSKPVDTDKLISLMRVWLYR